MMDVVFLTMIITTIIVPLFGLFPASRVTLRKAHHIQTAVFAGRTTGAEPNAGVVSHPLDTSTQVIMVPLQPASPQLTADDYMSIVPYHQTIAVTEDNVPYQVNIDLYVEQTRTSPNRKRPDGTAVLLPIMLDAYVQVQDPRGWTPVTLSSRLLQDVTQMSKL